MNEARKMKRRRVLYLVAVAAMLAAAFLVWPSGPKEPVYQGKPLTQWIDEAADVGIFEQTDYTHDAMRTFGTNAVPFLLNEFTRPTSRWRGRLCAWGNRQSFFKIHFRTDEARVRLAGRGLMLLETNAASALPVVARYLDDPVRDVFVIDILANQGEAALPYLTARFASKNPVTITNVLCTLWRLARRSDPAREALFAALSHPSPTLRAAAVEPWSEVAKNQGDVVPRLVSLASDPSPLVRQAATNQLVWLRQQHENPISAAAADALVKLQTNALPQTVP
jgi:hypothetical protein